jgi:hypothetical protein
MSDFFDDASETEQLHRELAIRAVRNQPPLKFSGHCLYCNETIVQGRFCSAECREDYEMEQKFKKLTGHR